MALTINSASINSIAVNSFGVPAGQSLLSGSGLLIEVEQSVVITEPAGQIVSIEQGVYITGSGVMVTLDQTVDLKITGSGVMVALDQSVAAGGSGVLFEISQTVRDPVELYQFSQPEGATLGWPAFDLIVAIDGKTIDSSYLYGTITITRSEGDSALADITLLPAPGLQNLSQYHGKEVVILASSETRTTIIYKGLVDVPDIDLLGKKITLRCTDSRSERNNNQSQAFISGIGYWSPSVFSKPTDKTGELEQRLETIPYSWDYSADGTGLLTAWKPKDTPDFYLADASIFYRNPEVTVLSRGRVTNKIKLSLTYNYQLLRHRKRDYSFDAELGAIYYAAWGLPPTNIQLKQAIESAGWPYDNYQFIGLDPAGRYDFHGVAVYWSPIKHTANISPKLDADGHQVTDQNGSPVYEQTSRKSVDSTNVYASTAIWEASKRWSQNVTESIEITLQAPQSIQQYGEVATEASYGLADDYDATDWENYEAHKAPPVSANQSANGDYIITKASDIAGFNAMALTALNRESTKIIKGHRDNRVDFEVPCWPDVELYHTIETTGGTVKAKGKVSKIQHSFDLIEKEASTNIELSLSQSVGIATTTPITVPARPALIDASYVPQAIKLVSHTIPLNGEQDPNWTGYIFQEKVRAGASVPAGLKAPVAMIIDTPDIDDESRDTRQLTATQTYEIEIRNDPLEVIF